MLRKICYVTGLLENWNSGGVECTVTTVHKLKMYVKLWVLCLDSKVSRLQLIYEGNWWNKRDKERIKDWSDISVKGRLISFYKS